MVWIDGWGLIYGLGPIDLVNTSVPLPESIEEQTRKIVRNLDAILKDRQLSRRHVVAVRPQAIGDGPPDDIGGRRKRGQSLKTSAY